MTPEERADALFSRLFHDPPCKVGTLEYRKWWETLAAAVFREAEAEAEQRGYKRGVMEEREVVMREVWAWQRRSPLKQSHVEYVGGRSHD